MDEILARCGYRCDLCPAYRENLAGEEYQRRIVAGWKQFYDADAEPADVYCDGCLDLRKEARRPDTASCGVRTCAVERGIANCANCQDYPCAKAASKPLSRANIEARVGRALSPEEYRLFVQPYEADRHLGTVRRHPTDTGGDDA